MFNDLFSSPVFWTVIAILGVALLVYAGMWARSLYKNKKKVDRLREEARQARGPQEPVHSEEKPGRNDPCPCGSGQKYKKCCGHPAQQAD